MKNEIVVLVVEPGNEPCTKTVRNELKEFQKIVGGYIEVVYPFSDPVLLVCNEEGKLDGLPWNAMIPEIGDMICGTFFLCESDEEGEFISLSDEMIKKYAQRFI